ncbi:MAG: DUF881 domain-containing protein [Phascolarctobacterium sp.]|nr:DUF881 domain-containing protein [Phascolarctobacterium sp.]
MRELFTMDMKGKLTVAAVFMVLGFMLSAQYRVTESQKSVRRERVEDLTDRLKAQEAENKKLQKEIEDFKKNAASNISESELGHLHLLAGTTPVSGKGVEIVLDDSKIPLKAGENPNLYILHDEDLLRVLNELRASGAEAISMNEQRIVSTSEIRCAGPTVSVNNVRVAAPYSLKAIGEPKTLSSALRIKGGVVDTFQFWGIQVKISESDNVKIPALKVRRGIEFAKVEMPKENPMQNGAKEGEKQ